MVHRKIIKSEIGFVDPGRAAELLGYSYNAIKSAIKNGALVASVVFDRKGGIPSPLILKTELERYRLSLIQRYETMPQYADRAKALKKKDVMA